MARTRPKHAPKGASGGGVCRPVRPPGAPRPRGPEWVRPYKRAQRLLDDAVSLIFSTIYAVFEAGRCAHERPFHSARKLLAALKEMTAASLKLAAAKQDLDEATAALARSPEPPTRRHGDGAELIELALKRCDAVEQHILMATQEVLFGVNEHLEGMATGELVPEKNWQGLPRPRIVGTPHPLFVRAFLTARRRRRVAERITPVLRRRRRTPLPAEVRVPRPNLLGRAPPLSSICSL